MDAKSLTPLLILHALALAILMGAVRECRAEGDDIYRQGSDFANQIGGQGTGTIEGVKPGDVIPNYTDNPKEKGYYGGVQAHDASNLKTDGGNAWSQTEVGKAVTDSVMKNPKEPISHDAPFIQAGKDIADKADSIVGKTGPDCKAEQVTRSTFTRHVCERDLGVLRTCDRAADISGHHETRYENRSAHIDKSALRWWREGDRIRGAFTAPFSGKLNTGAVYIEMQHELHSYGVPLAFSLLGNEVRYGRDDWGSRPLNVGGVMLTQGQQVDIVIRMDSGGNLGAFLDAMLRQLNGGGGGFPMTFHVKFDGSTAVQFWVPTTSVPADCPLGREAGAVKVNTVCSEPGGERPVVVNGRTYTVSASCWRFTDTYRLQEASQGSCEAYAGNSACTVATHACAFHDEQGACLQENVTYFCEARTQGKVMMCGGQMYCLDGTCDKQKKGTQGHDFAHAVSALAAVAAAGKDVAQLNGIDVRAFTGKGQACRKAFVGFSDCCKDAGWGNSVGLAHCSDEEKALGKAKENKLTVSIGEYCSKKVLGVCLQKKRSYCQFDSKLAQIVQQQGRAWQLGIGFGGAKSPDCRGITVDELQRINFDRLDFANFYEDLMKNQKVPEDAALVEKVKQQITQRMQEAQK